MEAQETLYRRNPSWAGVDAGVIFRGSLLHGADPGRVQTLLTTCPVLHLEPGETLLMEGQCNHALYLVLDGRLSVQLSAETPPRQAQLGPGECVGEVSLIDKQPVTANVTAQQPSRVLRIGEEVMWGLVSTSPEVGRNLLQVLSLRLRQGRHLLVETLEQKQIYKRDAERDPATGLFNRRSLDVIIKEMLAHCRERGVWLSLIMMDVDHFKQYNDRYGHLTGDRVLRTAAATLLNNLRQQDIAARFGGDEFVALLPETDIQTAVAIAERLRSACATLRIETENGMVVPPVTLSLGVAQSSMNDTPEKLISAADAALYRAKGAGRNQVSN